MLEESISLGFMWECPDLLKFADRDIFVFSPQGLEAEGEKYNNIYQSGYFTGEFLENGTFVKDNQPFKELDRGFEFYAPQTFVDDAGRMILYGWVGVMEPGVEAAVPTRQQGWIHALTIPREIRYENGKLIQYPIAELANLRKENPTVIKSIGNEAVKMTSLQQDILIEWSKAAKDFVLTVRNEVKINYQANSRKLTVIRTNWKTMVKEERSVF